MTDQAIIARANENLVDVVGRYTRLTAKGKVLIGLCPFHAEKTPSFRVHPGKFFICFGCGMKGDAIRFVMEKERRPFPDAVAYLTSEALARAPTRHVQAAPPEDDAADRARRAASDAAIWHGTRPGAGTLVESYMRRRCITLAVPDSLRFHPRVYHYETETFWAAMVAMIVDMATRRALGLHITYLAPDGDKAPVKPAKRMRRSAPSIAGGVVMLSYPRAVMMIGEGIENTQSARQLIDVGEEQMGFAAALSLTNLRAVRFADGTREAVHPADQDEKDLRAADLERQEAMAHWHQGGVRGRLVKPPRGMDFNDWLRSLNRPSEAGRS